MITAELSFQENHLAWGFAVHKDEQSVAALVNDVADAPWWALLGRWRSRQYRKRMANIFAYSLDVPQGKVDKALKGALNGRLILA